MSDTKRTPENHAREYGRMRQDEIRKLEGKPEHEDTVDPVDELVENPRKASRMGRQAVRRNRRKSD